MNTIFSKPSTWVGAFSIFLAMSAFAAPAETLQPGSEATFRLLQQIAAEHHHDAMPLSKVLRIGGTVGMFHWVITDEGQFLLPLSLKTKYIDEGLVSVSRKRRSFCIQGIPPDCGMMGKIDN